MSGRFSGYCIGVDGGGTGCRAAVARADGTIISRGNGGPANVTSNAQEAVANTRTAILQAAENAGLSKADLDGARVHFGLAGVLGQREMDLVAEASPVANARVTDDRAISLAGALGGRNGVLLAIGTGTIIAASRDGRQQFVGGWGLHLDDQGSGAWLGQNLLRDVMLAHDGLAPETDLIRATRATFGGTDDIVRFAATAGPGDYAELAPEIVAAARAGDATALSLMRRGSEYFARALDVLGLGAGDVLCLSGGLGPHYHPYLPELHTRRIEPAAGTALDGAVRLAREAGPG